MIGYFKRSAEGFSGLIDTVGYQSTATIVPSHENAPGKPEYRVLSPGGEQLGTASTKMLIPGYPFLIVELSHPAFTAKTSFKLISFDMQTFCLI